MEHRPQLNNQPTSLTLGEPELLEPETKTGTPEPTNNIQNVNPSSYGARGEESASRSAQGSSTVDRRMYDTVLLVVIIVLLLWPWIFWGVLFRVKGIQMDDRVAAVVVNHPYSTNFFVTLVGNIVRLIIAILFSFAIVRFAQERLATTNVVTVFHISLLSAFKYQSWPWGLKALQAVVGRGRWLLMLPVILCIGAFAFVPSGITSLLTPVPFNKTTTLTGTELDFSSTASDCVQFLNAHPLSNNCDWQVFKNTSYTSCLGQNQLVDVLESGRGNILSLLEDNSQSFTFSQLGSKNGLHFLGPLRGVLPIGPNGVPDFDTVGASPISDFQKKAAMLSYNYTLDLQGLNGNVTCIYDEESPIKFGVVDNATTLALQYNGTCDGQTGFLENYDVLTFVSVNADNGLGYWACKSSDSEQQSYHVYLRGRANYTNSIGNITCTISPVQPAVFPVTYQLQPNVFSVADPILTASVVYPSIIERALVALGGVVHGSQNWDANAVAESVITFAVKSFGLKPYDRTPEHLRLYAAMIRGMLEYETAYIRLIYSTVENPPASCIRTVEGTATYQVIGWLAQVIHIGFLIPLTLVNLSSLALIVTAMVMAKGQGHSFDPTDTRPLLAASVAEGGRPDEWEDEVLYRPNRPVADPLGFSGNMSRAVSNFAGNIFPSN